MIRSIVKQVTPPCLIDMARWLKNIISPSPFYGVSGNFSSWQEALEYCEKNNHGKGYESTNIIEKVARAIQEVRDGRAEFERDSVLFYEKDYNFPFLSALFLSFNGIDNTRTIYVVDFGGSLGSTFFQNRSLFATMKQHVVWSVIEQKHFVDRGRMEVPEVDFYYDMAEYVQQGGEKDILLLSSVLEYMEKPYDMLRNLIKEDWRYVIIERSQYNPDDKDRCMVQKVPPSIYEAQYPLWSRSESKQHAIMEEYGYKRVLDWELPFRILYKDERGILRIPFKGFLYKKIN